MLDSIAISLSGLTGYSKGLLAISNNVANMNTPGFKGTEVLFQELFNDDLPQSTPQQNNSDSQIGYGVNAFSTTTNFQAGDPVQTGNPLDLAVQGDGYFVLQSADGQLAYTRAGQFDFNADGFLINKADGSFVMGLDDNGQLSRISLAGLGTSAAKATTTINLSGNLSSTATTDSLSSVAVIDASGNQHLLNLQFANTGATTPGTWTVTEVDGPNTIATQTLTFTGGQLSGSNSKVEFDYPVAGQPTMHITLDFGDNTTSFASGTTSTLAVSGQDGFTSGTLTDKKFDDSGALSLSYSNGQSVQKGHIALATFSSTDVLKAIGASSFSASTDQGRLIGAPGTPGFGSIGSGMVENSNVDLSQEFSNLILMQRGYQASSETISTANDMIQTLFNLKSGGQ